MDQICEVTGLRHKILSKEGQGSLANENQMRRAFWQPQFTSLESFQVLGEKKGVDAEYRRLPELRRLCYRSKEATRAGVHGTERIDERAAGKENCEDTQRVQPDCSKECRRIHSCEKTSQKRWKGWPNRQEDMLPLSVPSRQTRKPIIHGALSKFPWGAQKDDVLITGIVNSRQSITSVLSHKP